MPAASTAALFLADAPGASFKSLISSLIAASVLLPAIGPVE
jgi:hypothetical protein